MESPLSLLRMHWDHEPPLTRPSATLSPSDGEREGVRGRFMESPPISRDRERIGTLKGGTRKMQVGLLWPEKRVDKGLCYCNF